MTRTTSARVSARQHPGELLVQCPSLLLGVVDCLDHLHTPRASEAGPWCRCSCRRPPGSGPGDVSGRRVDLQGGPEHRFLVVGGDQHRAVEPGDGGRPSARGKADVGTSGSCSRSMARIATGPSSQAPQLLRSGWQRVRHPPVTLESTCMAEAVWSAAMRTKPGGGRRSSTQQRGEPRALELHVDRQRHGQGLRCAGATPRKDKRPRACQQQQDEEHSERCGRTAHLGCPMTWGRLVEFVKLLPSEYGHSAASRPAQGGQITAEPAARPQTESPPQCLGTFEMWQPYFGGFPVGDPLVYVSRGLPPS